MSQSLTLLCFCACSGRKRQSCPRTHLRTRTGECSEHPWYWSVPAGCAVAEQRFPCGPQPGSMGSSRSHRVGTGGVWAPQALTANGLASRREAALQEGLRQAVAVPLALAETVASLWPVLRELALCVNLACRSDLQVRGRPCCQCRVKGQWASQLLTEPADVSAGRVSRSISAFRAGSTKILFKVTAQRQTLKCVPESTSDCPIWPQPPSSPLAPLPETPGTRRHAFAPCL